MVGSTARGTPERPTYSYVPEPNTRNHFMVRVDEGWRDSIVCTGMYEWAARWLVNQLQGRPFAPERPG